MNIFQKNEIKKTLIKLKSKDINQIIELCNLELIRRNKIINKK